MKKAGLMVVAVVALLAMVMPASATGNLSIGYMSRQEVLMNFEKYRAAYQELEAIKAPLERELKEKQEEIRTLQRDLETGLMYTESRKQQLQDQIRQKMMELQQKAEENQRTLMEQEKAKIEPLMKLYEAAVAKVAAAHGYNAIMDLADPMLIWIDPTLDIGKEVIAEINGSR